MGGRINESEYFTLVTVMVGVQQEVTWREMLVNSHGVICYHREIVLKIISTAATDTPSSPSILCYLVKFTFWVSASNCIPLAHALATCIDSIDTPGLLSLLVPIAASQCQGDL